MMGKDADILQARGEVGLFRYKGRYQGVQVKVKCHEMKHIRRH